MVSRKMGFCDADSATTSFHCTGRNFELAIAMAVTVFGRSDGCRLRSSGR